MARKKALSLPVSCRLNWVEKSSNFSIRRQCSLAGLSRSNLYYNSVPESEENLQLMLLVDAQYMKRPEYGYPRMTDWWVDEGYRKGVRKGEKVSDNPGAQRVEAALKKVTPDTFSQKATSDQYYFRPPAD